MTRFTAITPICLAWLLTACAGNPPATLEADADIVSISNAAPAAAAYRRVVEGARTCYTSMLDVTADYFPADQSGRVSAAMKTPFVVSAAFVIDITPAPNGSTVRIVSHRSATGVPAAVTHWLSGDYSVCNLK